MGTDDTENRAGWWPERLAAFSAVAGVLISILLNFHVFRWQQSGSDFKTLYASALCLRHGLDGYDFNNIATVFRHSGVALPTSWYAHAPVYPPFTLAAIIPFTALGMPAAVILFMALSGIAISAAAFALSRTAALQYGLSRPWRLALIAVAAASPALSFALEMGNVSALASALGILAVTSQPGSLFALAALMVALFLKPHLALWIVVALLLSHRPSDRSLALRASSAFAVAVAAIALWLQTHHQLAPQFLAYRDMVKNELAGGSMNPADRELLGVAAQITSLKSLLAYRFQGSLLNGITLTALAFLAIILLYSSHNLPDAFRLQYLAAWNAFGLLATYHRAHDSIFLIVLLPWLIARLQKSMRDPLPYACLALYLAMALGLSWETLQSMAEHPDLRYIAELVLYRQAPLATLLLLILLVTTLLRALPSPQRIVVSPSALAEIPYLNTRALARK